MPSFEITPCLNGESVRTGRVYKRVPASDRLEGKFVIADRPSIYRPDLGPCWTWIGSKSKHPSPYAMVWDGDRNTYAHRVSYEKTNGPIPNGLHIDHLCRNTLCINPLHLEAVTCAVNILRGIGPSAKRAVATHCEHGHEFTAENTRVNKSGYRGCKACEVISSRKMLARPEVKAARAAKAREKTAAARMLRWPGGVRPKSKWSDPEYVRAYQRNWARNKKASHG